MLKLTRNWLLLPVLAAFCCVAGIAEAAESVQEWEVIVPTGEIEKSTIEPAPRINSLEGKTVVLRWNGKNNGNLFLDRLAELFAQKHPETKVVKSYVEDKSINNISANAANSELYTKSVLSMKPDLVIAAQAD
jgi:hypothetical protein